MKLWLIVLASLPTPYVRDDDGAQRIYHMCSDCYAPKAQAWEFGIDVVSKRQLMSGKCEICEKEFEEND